MKRNPKIIYDNIRVLCNKHGITVGTLEREVGINKGEILTWQKAKPRIDRVAKIANYFNVSTDYFFIYEVEKLGKSLE